MQQDDYKKADVETSRYEIAHQKKPRGIGSWVFCPFTKRSSQDYLDYAFFVNNQKYGEAKKKAAEHFGRLGWSLISLLS